MVDTLMMDPPALGGLWIRAAAGPRRQMLLERIEAQAHQLKLPFVRMALHTDPDQLRSGIDAIESLTQGRAIWRQGLLERARGGFVVVPMAERMPSGLLAPLIAAVDARSVALVMLDESTADEPPLRPALADRLGYCVDLRDETQAWAIHSQWPASEAFETEGHSAVLIDSTLIERTLVLAQAMAIDSMRPALAALAAMKRRALREGRASATEEDWAWAVNLCLIAHARVFPTMQEQQDQSQAEPESKEDSQEPAASETQDNTASTQEQQAQADLPASEDTLAQSAEPPSEMSVDTQSASLPAGLLAAWQSAVERASQSRGSAPQDSGSGQMVRGRRAHGRRIGTLHRRPRGPEDRLALLATIREAVPYQAIRNPSKGLLALRPDDMHIWRYKQARAVTTVFVVDASGSTALQRLGEAKGAVEILLAECYSRRDRVALVAFSGRGAQLLLPPTRSLLAARRALTGLAGGGGSPIASAFALGHSLAHSLVKAGNDVVWVVLSDGRANLCLDGSPGRAQALEQAEQMARRVAPLALHRLFIDTAMRPDPNAQRLASALSARYLPLPAAQARGIHVAIQETRRSATGFGSAS